MSQVSTHTARFRASSSAIWMVVVLLAVIAACLMIEVGASVASGRVGQRGDSAAGNSTTLAVSGQISRDSYGLYLVDLENRTICVYQWLPTLRELRLAAARTYIYDRELDAYNTQPLPKEIRNLVAGARRLEAPATRPTSE